MISWGNDTSGQKDIGVDSVARESEAKPLSECARNLFDTVETCEILQPACLPVVWIISDAMTTTDKQYVRQ